MLVAILEGTRILAAQAKKDDSFLYLCPRCRSPVILKKGVKVIHHFAHKPKENCEWSSGETLAHLNAKMLFHQFFSANNYTADVEVSIGNSRADVYIKGLVDIPAVIEVQHTSIKEEEIIRRTRAYFSLGIAVNWISLISINKLLSSSEGDDQGFKTRTGFYFPKYTPKPFERWLEELNRYELWFLDTDTWQLFKGKFKDFMIDVPQTDFGGGYSKKSKRWEKLELFGGYTLDQLTFESKNYDVPSSYINYKVFRTINGNVLRFKVK